MTTPKSSCIVNKTFVTQIFPVDCYRFLGKKLHFLDKLWCSQLPSNHETYLNNALNFFNFNHWIIQSMSCVFVFFFINLNVIRIAKGRHQCCINWSTRSLSVIWKTMCYLELNGTRYSEGVLQNSYTHPEEMFPRHTRLPNTD